MLGEQFMLAILKGQIEFLAHPMTTYFVRSTILQTHRVDAYAPRRPPSRTFLPRIGQENEVGVRERVAAGT